MNTVNGIHYKFYKQCIPSLTFTLSRARPDLTTQSVGAAMQEIIASGVFELNGAPLATAVDARIVERNVTELING